MKAMKKALAAVMVLAMIFSTGQALAAKARYIETEEDAAYHASHLNEKHFREGAYAITGENVMLRRTPGVKSNIASLDVGEAVQIIDLYDTWAKVTVMSRPPQGKRSHYGLTGWIGVEYIECGCSEAAYYGEATAAEAQEAAE